MNNYVSYGSSVEVTSDRTVKVGGQDIRLDSPPYRVIGVENHGPLNARMLKIRSQSGLEIRLPASECRPWTP